MDEFFFVVVDVVLLSVPSAQLHPGSLLRS